VIPSRLRVIPGVLEHLTLTLDESVSHQAGHSIFAEASACDPSH